jgi:hypothetical protein
MAAMAELNLTLDLMGKCFKTQKTLNFVEDYPVNIPV